MKPTTKLDEITTAVVTMHVEEFARANAAVLDAAPLAPEVVDELRYLPVQHDGRAMPLDTQAREAARKITGEIAWRGIDPVALLDARLGGVAVASLAHGAERFLLR